MFLDVFASEPTPNARPRRPEPPKPRPVPGPAKGAPASEATVERAKRLRAEGWGFRRIAAEIGVSVGAVHGWAR